MRLDLVPTFKGVSGNDGSEVVGGLRAHKTPKSVAAATRLPVMVSLLRDNAYMVS